MEEEEVGAEGDGEEDEDGDGEDHEACGQDHGKQIFFAQLVLISSVGFLISTCSLRSF